MENTCVALEPMENVMKKQVLHWNVLKTIGKHRCCLGTYGKHKENTNVALESMENTWKTNGKHNVA